MHTPSSSDNAPPRPFTLLFLVGARRSGTNWVQRILTSHPQIVAMPSETYLFSHGIQPLRDLFQHSSPGSPLMGKVFSEHDRLIAELRGLTDAVFSDNHALLGPSSSYLLERTPWHAKHLELIAEIYPEARVLHLVRDGRAVARSLMTLEPGEADIAAAAREWRDCVACRNQGPSLFGDRFRELRYETLMADTGGEARAVFEWLGLEVRDDLITATVAEAEVEFNVDPASPGVATDKWRSQLTDEQLHTVLGIAGDELADLGYIDDARTVASNSRRPKTVGPSGAKDTASRRRKWLRGRARARASDGPTEKERAREARWELLGNLAVVEQFNDAVARGSLDEASALCDANASATLSAEPELAGRGPAHLERLLHALHTHRQPGSRQLSSTTHSSRRMFTVLSTYLDPSGRRWSQTAVFEVTQGSITSVDVARSRSAD